MKIFQDTYSSQEKMIKTLQQEFFDYYNNWLPFVLCFASMVLPSSNGSYDYPDANVDKNTNVNINATVNDTDTANFRDDANINNDSNFNNNANVKDRGALVLDF